MSWFLHKSYTLLSDLVWLLCCLWAAGMSTYLTLLVLLGALATKASGGRRAGLIMFGALLVLAVTTSTLMLLASVPRMARRSATTLSPSAA